MVAAEPGFAGARVGLSAEKGFVFGSAAHPYLPPRAVVGPVHLSSARLSGAPGERGCVG